jgi:dipeptide/tripeptide permease
MKSSSQNQAKIFKGAGWLLGLIVFIVAALVIVTLSENFVVAIAASLPIGIVSAISFEQKLQSKTTEADTKKTKMMINLILLGFIVFVAIYMTRHLL